MVQGSGRTRRFSGQFQGGSLSEIFVPQCFIDGSGAKFLGKVHVLDGKAETLREDHARGFLPVRIAHRNDDTLIFRWRARLSHADLTEEAFARFPLSARILKTLASGGKSVKCSLSWAVLFRVLHGVA